MQRFALVLSILAVFTSIIFYNSYTLQQLFKTTETSANISTTTTTSATISSQESMNTARATMAKTLAHAKITPHKSATRGHSDHGWLNTYHSFSFADWYNPRFTHFGSLRVLNEDRVKANSGFPTHPHRDFEIFSYLLSGELTHRDSMLQKGAEGGQSDKFYRMHRGDVQFTTGGTGIAHSEFNEHNKDTVHFLQIWALPWKRGLTPRYHTKTFSDESKREGFVPILSPLVGGVDATAEQEKVAQATIEGTIPIHADFVMAAGLIPSGGAFEWIVGGKATEATKRKVFVHVPMTKKGKTQIKIAGRDEIFSEGDGAFIDNVAAGDKLSVESVGEVEAEVIVLDTA